MFSDGSGLDVECRILCRAYRWDALYEHDDGMSDDQGNQKEQFWEHVWHYEMTSMERNETSSFL